MKEDCVIDVDLADVWTATDRKKLIRTLAWGDQVANVVRPLAKNEVLKVNFVDVQQGDGAVIESPDGKVILGGWVGGG